MHVLGKFRDKPGRKPCAALVDIWRAHMIFVVLLCNAACACAQTLTQQSTKTFVCMCACAFKMRPVYGMIFRTSRAAAWNDIPHFTWCGPRCNAFVMRYLRSAYKGELRVYMQGHRSVPRPQTELTRWAVQPTQRS